jgi:ATP-dependent protease HslVU (ClpYQ) peptidase subunit
VTVIAAIATDDRVVMGSDTRADYGGTAVYKAEGKIGWLMTPQSETVLLAASGNAGMLPALLRNLKIGDTPDPADHRAADEWASAVSEAITGVLADANPPMLTTADGSNSANLDGTVLLAWRQHLWFIHTHGAIRPSAGVISIGSGSDVALGSLYTAVHARLEPEAAVDLAVRLACTYAGGCGIDERGPILHSTV